MGKKLLFLVFLTIAYLMPTLVLAQCPTSVGITLDTDNTICAGTSVTFTATPTGGTNLSYEWFIGSASSQSGTSNTFTSTSLNNSDKIKVTVSSTDDTTCNITSSIITMTVNPVLTPSVSISASKTTICPGENIIFNASPINGGNNPSYVWRIGTAIQSSSSSTLSTTTLTDGQSVTAELTSNATCASPITATSSPINITVKAGTPAIPAAITGDSQVCPGISSLTYSIAAVANATSYEWTLPSGWSGTSTSNSISATSGATGSGTISVKAKNDCGTSAAQTFAVTILDGTPNTPGIISGDAQVCPGLTKTYSIAAVSRATTYNWTVPTGWSIASGAGTNSINVTSGTEGQNGNVSVTAGNSCGTSTAKILAVSVKPGTPAVPTTISGTINICPGTTNTYSIAAIANATSYIWTLPNGWTGTSTSTSINATSNSTGGNISVKAINDCGTSAVQTLAITIKSGIPATPSAISGSTTVCPNTSETYSVTNDATATEYSWTLPNGWAGTSTTNSITVTTGTSGSGNISVQAKNDCGTSAIAASIAVSIKAPAPVMSGTISGPASVCSGSSVTYTIPGIANADSYIWSLPGGWSGTSTSNSITTTAGSSGNISVIAKNTCGDSAASINFAVTATSGVPTAPGAITTNLPVEAICPPAVGITFSVTPITGATSYNWTLPTGWEITSGDNTNAITVSVNSSSATTTNASVSVKAVNICGQSASQTLSGIVIKSHVITNIGADITICKNRNPITINGTIDFGGKLKIDNVSSTGTGAFNGVPNGPVDTFNFTYTPSQNDIDTKSQVTIKLTTQTPTGACGPGIDEMVIFFKPDPTASIAGTSTICTGNATDLTFNATPNTIVTYKKNGGADQTITVGSSGTVILNTGALTANTTYSLVSVKNAVAPDCPKTITGSAVITVTQKPTATISYAGNPLCKTLTSALVTLTGTTGGTYSAPTGLTINPSNGAINPSTSTAGTYTVTYNTPASGGCQPVSATTQVTITALPTAAISYTNAPFCKSLNTAQPVSLSGTNAYTGGTYSSTAGLSINASTGAITPSTSTAGTYTITYETPASGGCAKVSTTTNVIITAVPTATISYTNSPFCASDGNSKLVTLNGTGAYQSGTYSSTAGLTINASSGEISPSTSTPGSYTVTYKTPDAGGCTGITATTNVAITETPSAIISYSGPFCQSSSSSQNVTFTNTVGAYQGGTFSATGGLTINSSTGAIIPNQSGTHTITYKIPASGGCAEVVLSTQVTITPKPAAIISYSGPFCTSDTSPKTVTFSNTAGAYQTGVFTGTSGLSIAADGSITPSTSTKGSHTVTYTIPATNGCENVVSTAVIEIFEEVSITNQPINVGICSTQAASFEVVASGDNLTYQWKRTDGAAISNATGTTTNKLSFSNATSTNAGEYYVEVTGNSACSSKAISQTVTLNIDENIIIIKPVVDETFCENDKTVETFEYIAHANGAELTFVWIKDGVELPTNNPAKYSFNKTGPTGANGEYSGTLTISDLVVEDNGKYAVKITGPDSFTCSEATSKTFTLSIKDQPDAPATTNLTYCQGDVASALTATGTNLKWYETETGDDLITGTPSPNTTAVGSTSYWVSQTPNECESPRAELVVTIKEKPAVPTTTAALSFCLNEVVTTPLTATGVSGASINWYSTANSTTALSTAPIPNTSANVVTNYWVSQTLNGCESDRVQVTITVNPLPIFTASADKAIICSDGSTNLKTSVTTNTYSWSIKGTNVEIGTGSTFTVSPTATTTYIVKGTNASGCSSLAEVTVNVEEKSVAGTISGAKNVCISSNSGILTLSGQLGNVVNWEKSLDGTTWTPVNPAITTTTYNYTNLTQSTWFRAEVKNGTACASVKALGAKITVDTAPIGGKLLFTRTTAPTFSDRIYLTCENPTQSSLLPINISDKTGTIVAWKYRKSTATNWTTILVSGANFTGPTLSAAQIFALGITETIVFQVEIASGVCSPNALSQTAILSVIPSTIKPAPVSVNPDVVCLGEQVTLTSSTGYTDRPNFLDQGAFDNASITNHGWRVRRNGNTEDLGFDTDANNTRPDRWKRATRHQFTTASITSPYTTREDLYISSEGDNASGNKGFAVVSSDNSATMETPVFAIGGIDQAILTWDQMFNLTPGASIRVEISTDGGNTYSNILYSASTLPDTSPLVPTNTTGISSGNYDGFASGTAGINKMRVDLGYYMGQQNLRIRFSYIGVRIGDVWAIDNINIPDGPRGVSLVWYDYTDATKPPVYIGNTENVNWTPTKIGANVFEIRTKLLLDSNGTSCQSIENFERVKAFVFDKYISTTTVVSGTCGDNFAQLAGVVNGTGSINGGPTQGVITSFPTLDGYTAAWTVVGPSGYIYSESHFTSATGISPAIKDANAKFNPGLFGTFTLTWTLISTAKNDNGVLINNAGCPPVYTPGVVNIKDCTTLDFDGIDDYVDLGTNYSGNYSIEAWIRPESTTGTIISGAGFEIKMKDLPTTVLPNSRWYHIAVTQGKLFVDGIQVGSAGTGIGGNKTLIGARWNSTTKKAENHFSGWIEEVRIWKKPITQDQIKFMMNQHLQNAANMGKEIPMPVPGSLLYTDLEGYYPLISKIPDPKNLEIFDVNLMPSNGLTPDISLNNITPGRLYNMTTDQENTAPLPYISGSIGDWETGGNTTWLRPLVWDDPNSNGIDGTPIEWNIVRTKHDIESTKKDITVLGLISETGKLNIVDPGSTANEYNSGQMLRVTHYLKLDGNIDLVGESQLLQDQGSILEETSKGWLERDQQGKVMSFNYNYWSSPVSAQGSPNNSPYLPGDVMSYNTGSAIEKLQFTADSNPYGADNTIINTCPYWLWKFKGTADDYDSWIFIGKTGSLETGEGHTMKGTTYTGTPDYSHSQNYIYKGKPHNGDFNLNIGPNLNYLIGNPYPSALDVKEFIRDNIEKVTFEDGRVSEGRNNKNIFDGTVYLWDHFSGGTHILREYIGGYATLNLLGGVEAIATDDRINSNTGLKTDKTPKHSIPVGQGFFVNTDSRELPVTIAGGDIVFKNSQRVFERESTGNSIFLKPETVVKTGKEEVKNTIPKIRISFRSPKGYNRQLLVGAHPSTTNGFDLGYDAPIIEYNTEDMFWLQGSNYLVIQGVPDFGKEQVLPIGVRIEKAGVFTIKIDTLENINASHTIYIKDVLLDTIHDVRSSPYVTSAEPGEITDRFQLIFYKESKQDPDPIGGDPVVDVPGTDPIIIDDLTEISLLHSYTENEMMVLNPKELRISAIYLYDLNGKLIELFDEVPSEKEIRLKVANFSNGIYVLKMHTEDQIVIRKIIIKK